MSDSSPPTESMISVTDQTPEAGTSAVSQPEAALAPLESAFNVYKPSSFASTPPPPPPDDYFTPTAADMKAAQSQLAARTAALVDAPLQLRSARELAEKAKRDRWPNTTIRIRFTDRTQLEKVFPSTSKIRSVYAFVRGLLREDIRPIKFILYQPPKRDLKVSDVKVRDLTLSQLQLAPASVLLLRFEDESLNASDYPAPLAAEVMTQAVDLPPPPNLDTSSSSPASSGSAGSKGTSSGSGLGEAGKKIPKWLKMGLKK